jgi:hypothetical protein
MHINSQQTQKTFLPNLPNNKTKKCKQNIVLKENANFSRSTQQLAKCMVKGESFWHCQAPNVFKTPSSQQ